MNHISTLLTTEIIAGTPFVLPNNNIEAGTGTYLYGEGFVLSKDEAETALALDEENKDVIFPYLTSDDVNSTPGALYTRHVINFGDMPEAQAQKYAWPFLRVKSLVKPIRDGLTGQIHEACFWKHWDRRDGLYRSIASVNAAIAIGRHTKYFNFVRCPGTWVFSDGLAVFASGEWSFFTVLQSAIYFVWADTFKTSLGETARFSMKDCFRNFPPPIVAEKPWGAGNQSLAIIGQQFHEARQIASLQIGIGLTDLYNLVHDQTEKAPKLQALRESHVEMDYAVVAAYGWDDIDLSHDFHDAKQGVRFTISEPARREVLQRLLKLNHERYEEEVQQGLHNKSKAKANPALTKPSKKASPVLFDLDSDDSPTDSQVASIGDVRQRLLCGFAVNVFSVAPGLRWNEYADLFAQATVARITANRFVDRLEQAKTLRKALPPEFKQKIEPDEWSRLEEQLLAHGLMKPFSETDGLVQLGPDAASFSLGEPLDQALRGYAQLMVGICLRRMDRLPSNQEQQTKEGAVVEESAQPREVRT